MLIAIGHFLIGLLVAVAIALSYARISGESGSSAIPFGIISGIICAALATFFSPWATPVVLLLFAGTAHKEYREARAYREAQARSAPPAEPAATPAGDTSGRDA
jgi:hypothetical protein